MYVSRTRTGCLPLLFILIIVSAIFVFFVRIIGFLFPVILLIAAIVVVYMLILRFSSWIKRIKSKMTGTADFEEEIVKKGTPYSKKDAINVEYTVVDNHKDE
ncbi:hypothetical protein AwErysi_08280 [Erysipelotrichaceae bacterium]|nr:hypothetical protein AwErysi_08280 [Erysipelotrichaceae bacterium]